jgi:hypothetical protein
MLRRCSTAVLVSFLLAGLLSSSAAAASCTDNFTGANEGQWSVGSNWSTHSVPEATAVACWPSNITVVDSGIEAVAAIHGGGLVVNSGALDFYHASEAGNSTLSGPLSVINSSFVGERYTSTPAVIELAGPLVFSGGQIEKVEIVQGAGTSVSIPAAASIPPDLDPNTSITTESPVTIGNPSFETGGSTTSITTTSTIALAPGLTLGTGGDIGTFIAAGVTPNTGPTYGFGADTLILTGGTTTVATGTTLYSGPTHLAGRRASGRRHSGRRPVLERSRSDPHDADRRHAERDGDRRRPAHEQRRNARSR